MPRPLTSRLCAILACLAVSAGAAPKDYFGITVVDDATGRGVPLVELRTVNEMTFFTDSNGVVAIDEPDLMGQTVHFSISSHGYEYPKDGFGYRGIALKVTPGGRETVKIHRVNVAERLYRMTGAGVYRDSVLLGLSVPTKEPLLNGLVMGQDTVEVEPYKGKLFWFFGDTQRPSYPLGLFATSGATSLPPGKGGLDPAKGVDLTYWVGKEGFSRATMPLPNQQGPIWVGGLFALKDEAGQERLLTRFVHLDHGGKVFESGLATWDDSEAVFKKTTALSLDDPLAPEGHPFRATEGGKTYLYFQPLSGSAMPWVRVQADMAHVTDQRAYEAFTCLAPGARFAGLETKLDRDAAGKLVYGWKRDAAVLGYEQQEQLVKAGKLAAAEGPHQLRDIETDQPVRSANGSAFWNPYRGRWVMITSQSFGAPSFLGETWFSEADTPAGPWVYARRVVTHDHYTFYNPTQHPFFDQDGGRLIYFEGTYTDTYSNNPVKTPRYNYNQVMYRLALDDPRLTLPEPVYRLTDASYATREGPGADTRGFFARVEGIPFYALPPGRSYPGAVPLYRDGSGALSTKSPAAGAKPLCLVLAAEPAADEKPSPAVVPLYELTEAGTGSRWYLTDPAQAPAGAARSPQPVCRVWRNPSSALMLDRGAASAR